MAYYTRLWQRHFYLGLAGATERLVTPQSTDFNWARRDPGGDKASVTPNRSNVSQLIWEQICNAHRRDGLDAVISYCFSGDVEVQLVKDTIRLGIPWVNFFCDSVHRFTEVEAIARVVSLNWFPEHAAIPDYQALGVPWLCLPYALNADFLPDLNCRSPCRPVGFVGMPTTNRITQLGCLRLLGCRVDIRGKGWVGQAADPFYSSVPKSRRLLAALTKRGITEKLIRRLVWPLVQGQASGALSDPEFCSFVRECRIILGLNQGRNERGRLSSYLKFRDLEFPGYGCCYLTEHNQDLENVFAVGQEILTYRSIGEAASQIRRSRRNPDQMIQKGLAGRRRVLAQHTWANRLDTLAQHL